MINTNLRTIKIIYWVVDMNMFDVVWIILFFNHVSTMFFLTMFKANWSSYDKLTSQTASDKLKQIFKIQSWTLISSHMFVDGIGELAEQGIVINGTKYSVCRKEMKARKAFRAIKIVLQLHVHWTGSKGNEMQNTVATSGRKQRRGNRLSLGLDIIWINFNNSFSTLSFK